MNSLEAAYINERVNYRHGEIEWQPRTNTAG